MRDKYYPPTHRTGGFHCPHCQVYAGQVWFQMGIKWPTTYSVDNRMEVSQCEHCRKFVYWFDERMIYPGESAIEPAHPDLPEDCMPFYEEAREIFSRSPRGAAALLRLVVQMLCKHLGGKGKNIDHDIAELVKNGLPVLVQQALDYCRVVGNNAVHPGEIVLEDDPDVAQQLFDMISFIVEDRITRPREIQMRYEKLPDKARDAIEKRGRT